MIPIAGRQHRGDERNQARSVSFQLTTECANRLKPTRARSSACWKARVCTASARMARTRITTSTTGAAVDHRNNILTARYAKSGKPGGGKQGVASNLRGTVPGSAEWSGRQQAQRRQLRERSRGFHMCQSFGRVSRCEPAKAAFRDRTLPPIAATATACRQANCPRATVRCKQGNLQRYD